MRQKCLLWKPLPGRRGVRAADEGAVVALAQHVQLVCLLSSASLKGGALMPWRSEAGCDACAVREGGLRAALAHSGRGRMKERSVLGTGAHAGGGGRRFRQELSVGLFVGAAQTERLRVRTATKTQHRAHGGDRRRRGRWWTRCARTRAASWRCCAPTAAPRATASSCSCRPTRCRCSLPFMFPAHIDECRVCCGLHDGPRKADRPAHTAAS